MTAKNGSTKSEGRSPSWPVISLDEALEKAQAIYEAEKRHATTREVMFQHWGYSVKSSGARQIAAALRSFGLIEPSGDNWKITDTAWRILADPVPNSNSRLEHIKTLALKPKLHQELWSKYGNELPSEPTLKSYLIFDRGFNSSSVDDFIKQYKRTIEFAQIEDDMQRGDVKIPENSSNDDWDDKSDTEEMPPRRSMSANSSILSENPMPNEGAGSFTMTLPDGNFLEIRVKKKLSSQEYDLLFDDSFFKFAKYSLADSSIHKNEDDY